MTREQIEKKAVERFPDYSNDTLHKHVTESNRQSYIEGALMVMEEYAQQKVKSVDLADVGERSFIAVFAGKIIHNVAAMRKA